jgi:two-component system, sensor histidine kinase LadS
MLSVILFLRSSRFGLAQGTFSYSLHQLLATVLWAAAGLVVWVALMPIAAAQALQPLPAITLNAQLKSTPIDALSAYWVDEATDTSIEQLTARTDLATLFTQRHFAQHHIVHGKVLWIRFDSQLIDTQSQWFAEISMATLDNATLFWKNPFNQWQKLQAGDVVPRGLWPQLDRYPVFRLLPDTAKPTTYYLRVVHDRVPFSAPLYIYRDSELVKQRQVEHFILGAYFGLLILVSVVCITMAFTMRDKTFIQYLLYVVSIGAYQATYTGIAALHIWPNLSVWADKANFVLPAIASVVGLWFVRSVARPNVFMPPLDKAALFLMATQAANTLAEIVHPTLLGFHLLTVLSIGIVLVVYAVAWYGWTRGDTNLRWMAVGFIPVVMGVMPQLLRNAGLIDTNFFTQYGVTLGSALEMPILLYGLVLRASTRREGRARAAGLPTQDPLTGLSNTREVLRNIHGAMTRASRYKQQYGLVLVELTNHAWFVKEHGSSMGDNALVLLSTRLQVIARDVDTAGRLSDNHFVVLIEGPCKPGYAAKVAAQIAACAHRPTNLLPVGASLKLRVTCALMPDPQALELGDDANAQLGWLIDSSEATHTDPRKAIRTINF